jgi:hypothetical protein
VLDELGKIFLADPILGLDVEQDYSENKTQVESQPKANSILQKSSIQVSKIAAHIIMSVGTFLHTSTWGPDTSFNQVQVTSVVDPDSVSPDPETDSMDPDPQN